MAHTLPLEISAQPDLVTCGPTCLHAIYRYYGETISLEQVISETRMMTDGGTLAVFLADHALRRGYRATIFSYNLQLFDPSWFSLDSAQIQGRLERQAAAKSDPRLQTATRGYVDFLELGGELRFEDLRPRLIRRILRSGAPMLTGLNATYLYNSMREHPDTNQYDDIRGEVVGHFVVLSGYDNETLQLQVSDPYRANPYDKSGVYSMDARRIITSILLGIVTYDANILVVEPR